MGRAKLLGCHAGRWRSRPGYQRGAARNVWTIRAARPTCCLGPERKGLDRRPSRANRQPVPPRPRIARQRRDRNTNYRRAGGFPDLRSGIVARWPDLGFRRRIWYVGIVHGSRHCGRRRRFRTATGRAATWRAGNGARRGLLTARDSSSPPPGACWGEVSGGSRRRDPIRLANSSRWALMPPARRYSLTAGASSSRNGARTSTFGAWKSLPTGMRPPAEVASFRRPFTMLLHVTPPMAVTSSLNPTAAVQRESGSRTPTAPTRGLCSWKKPGPPALPHGLPTVVVSSSTR